MSTGAPSDDDDSGPGYRHGTAEAWAVLRERVKAHGRTLVELEADARERDEKISDVRKVQIMQGTKIEELITFHKDLKNYARVVILGLFGAVGMQVLQLILKKGSP